MGELTRSKLRMQYLILIPFVLLLLLALLYIPNFSLPALENYRAYSLLEMFSFLLSVVACLAALKHFKDTHSSFYILIALGFFISGFDSFVRIITSVNILSIPLFDQSIFIKDSWISGRIILASIFLINVFYRSKYVSKDIVGSLVLESYFGPLMIIILGVTTIILLFPLEQFVWSVLPGFVAKTWPLIAPILTFIVGVFSIKLISQRGAPGMTFLLFLMISVIADAFMLKSTVVFDTNFIFAILIKNLSLLVFCCSLLFVDPYRQSPEVEYRFTISRQIILNLMTFVGFLTVLLIYIIRTQNMIIDINLLPSDPSLAASSSGMLLGGLTVAQVATSAKQFGIFLFLMGLVVGLFSIALAIIRITTPLKHITNTIDKISKGDLSAKAEHEINDEIGDLACAFDRTVVSLKLAMKKLHGGTEKETNKKS